MTNYESLSKADLQQKLADHDKERVKISEALDKKGKSSESFKPGDRLEVGSDGSIRLNESATDEQRKRVRESKVRTYRDLGLTQAGAEAAADHDLAG